MSRGCDPEPKMPTQSIIESQAACGVHVWGEHVCANSKDKAIGKRSKGGLSKVRFRCGACGRWVGLQVWNRVWTLLRLIILSLTCKWYVGNLLPVYMETRQWSRLFTSTKTFAYVPVLLTTQVWWFHAECTKREIRKSVWNLQIKKVNNIHKLIKHKPSCHMSRKRVLAAIRSIMSHLQLHQETIPELLVPCFTRSLN